jgi:hypothetical protein
LAPDSQYWQPAEQWWIEILDRLISRLNNAENDIEKLNGRLQRLEDFIVGAETAMDVE